VAILGMLPVALNASLEAQRETRAAFIARGIFADVATGVPQRVSADNPEATIYFNDAGEQVGTGKATFEAVLAYLTPDSAAAATNFATTQLPYIRLVLSTPVEAPLQHRSKYVFAQTLREP